MAAQRPLTSIKAILSCTQTDRQAIQTIHMSETAQQSEPDDVALTECLGCSQGRPPLKVSFKCWTSITIQCA